MREQGMLNRDKENTTVTTTPSERGRFARLLNGSQRRSLTITLRRVELAVWRLEERIAQQSPPQLILTRFTNPPTSDQQAALLQLTRRVREEIAQLVFDYDLEVGDENVLRSVMGEFSLLWCDLEDTRPQKLLRYGVVHPQANDVLGPPIQRLIQLMLAIDNVAKG